MRVAHLITRMIVGGAQENTLYNCLDLQNDFGDEVLLITGPAIGPEGDLLGSDLASTLQVELIDSMRREINPLRDLKAYWELRRLIGEFRPDVVHTHSAKAGVLGRAAAWNLKVPAVVHTIHGAPFHQYQSAISRNVFRLAERWASARCHQLISVADSMTELLVDAGVAKSEKFRTIYSGMDVDPFLNSQTTRQETRKKLGLNDQHILVGKIARLFHLKGHDDVIEAARAVVSCYANVRFLFVGDGLLKDDLAKKIQHYGLEENFIFTGLVDPHAVPELIAAMDILVHASYREGLARALPQALISGVPAISYDVDGAREVVLDGTTGCLIPAGDVAGIAEAMLKLVADPKMREKYGQQGRVRFAEQFRHQEMTRQIRQLYEDVLSQKRG